MINFERTLMWLRDLDALAGLPMIVIGLCLMLGGWRVGRVCVVLTLAALGAGLGMYLSPEQSGTIYLVVGGAILLGGVGVALKQQSTALLGGLIGAVLVMQIIAPLALQGWPLWLAMILAFLGVAMMCHVSQRTVVILITSFEGAVLLVAGFLSTAASVPTLFRFVETTHRSSSLFLPFMVFVPTMIGCFLQLGDSKQNPAGAANV